MERGGGNRTGDEEHLIVLNMTRVGADLMIYVYKIVQ